MSFVLPLAMFSLSVVAAPIPDWEPANIDAGIPALSFGAHSWNPLLKRSLVSSTSVTDSTSVLGNDLDAQLSSTLQDLATVNSALDSYLGTWFSSDDLVDSLGAGALNLALPASDLVVRAGEDYEAWVSIPDGDQAIADLESLSWVLLNDLACDLTESASIPVQSILVYRLDESSDATVYVSPTDIDFTLTHLPLDHALDTSLYTDIVAGSSDLGLGNDSNTATSLYSATHLDASTQAGSETDLLAPHDEPEINVNSVADSASDLLTSPSSSLNLDTDLVDGFSDSSVGVDIASDPGFSSPSNVAVSVGS